jgi:hypothetical protein
MAKAVDIGKRSFRTQKAGYGCRSVKSATRRTEAYLQSASLALPIACDKGMLSAYCATQVRKVC